jgi:uncharacterized RDD family membrane protein YckC
MPKCPKCQYFSFDSGDRCRNCGYDFSLALDLSPDDDLRIQNDLEPIGPLGDFALNDTPSTLPLFKPGADPDAPLVTPGAAPRAPLAVRRGAPTTGRPARQKRERPEAHPEPRLALDTAEIPVIAPPRRQPAPLPADPTPVAPVTDVVAPTAGLVSRVAAGAIDLVILGGIDLLVVYFTLKICDLTFVDILLLPAAPLLSFLLLVDGGYLTAFVAAGGQTIGKMATGIRVVPADPAAPRAERVTFGRAILRAIVFVFCLLPAGLGLVPALFGREHRGLHDRLADTRVVKA